MLPNATGFEIFIVEVLGVEGWLARFDTRWPDLALFSADFRRARWCNAKRKAQRAKRRARGGGGGKGQSTLAEGSNVTFCYFLLPKFEI